jgi:hypothetical protein
MKDCAMADRDIIANLRWRCPACYMNNAAILNIREAPDFNPVDISTKHCLKPDRTFRSDSDISNNYAIRGQKTALGYIRAFPAIRYNHNL